MSRGVGEDVGDDVVRIAEHSLDIPGGNDDSKSRTTHISPEFPIKNVGGADLSSRGPIKILKFSSCLEQPAALINKGRMNARTCKSERYGRPAAAAPYFSSMTVMGGGVLSRFSSSPSVFFSLSTTINQSELCRTQQTTTTTTAHFSNIASSIHIMCGEKVALSARKKGQQK